MGELQDKDVISLIIDSVKTHFNLVTQSITENISRLMKVIDIQSTYTTEHEKRIMTLEYENKELRKLIADNSEKTDKLETFINELKIDLAAGLEAIRKLAAKKFPLRYVISVIVAILSVPGVTKLLEFIIEVVKVKANTPIP